MSHSKTIAGRKAKSAGSEESKRAAAAAAASSASLSEEEDPDDPMQEGVLYEVKSIIGKRRKANRLEYEVQWAGFARATWEPAANLQHCQPLVDRFNAETAAEEEALQQSQTSGKAHKPSATHSPQAKLAAESTEEAPSSQSSKGAGVGVEALLPHGHKRERKKVEHFEPIDPTVERALRQEEHISKLSQESKSKKQKTTKGGGAAAEAKGEEEAEEFVTGDDVYEIVSIVGKKREGGKTFYLCKWAPSGGKTWEDTYEPEENIFAKDLITEFNERTKKGKRRKTAGGAAVGAAAGASAEAKSVSSGSEISPSQPTPSQPSQPSQSAPPRAAAAAAPSSTGADESPANIGVISDDEADVGDVVMVSSTVVTTIEDSPAPEIATAVPAGGDWSDPSDPTAQLAPLPLAPKSGAESLEAPTITATVTVIPSADAVFVSVQQSEDTTADAVTADTQVEPLASSLSDDPSTLAPSFEVTGEMITVAAAESKAASPPPPPHQPPPSSPTARSPQQHASSPSSSQEPKKHGIIGAISSVLHSVLGGGDHSEAKQQQQDDETMQQ